MFLCGRKFKSVEVKIIMGLIIKSLINTPYKGTVSTTPLAPCPPPGWLSWSRNTARLKRTYVDIRMRFSSNRLLHKSLLYVGNDYNRNVSVFRRLDITYSCNGRFDDIDRG